MDPLALGVMGMVLSGLSCAASVWLSLPASSRLPASYRLLEASPASSHLPEASPASSRLPEVSPASSRITMGLSREDLAQDLKKGVREGFPQKKYNSLIIKEFLARGGQATVHHVIGILPNGYFSAARKTLSFPSDTDPEAACIQACTELHMMVKLSPHRHITKPILAYRSEERLVYHSETRYHILMTPVADGGSLDDLFCALRKYPERMTPQAKVTLQHCFGCLTLTMAHIHGESIRHKDVKPENILVHQGKVLFSDFGIAFDFSPSQGGRSTTDGEVGLHSLLYSAPEVHERKPRNAKSDMFSLGVVLYKILSFHETELTGFDPPPSGLFANHADEMIGKIESIMTRDGELKLPLAAYKVVVAMLRKDQAVRISSEDALDELRGHENLFCKECWCEMGNGHTRGRRFEGTEEED